LGDLDKQANLVVVAYTGNLSNRDKRYVLVAAESHLYAISMAGGVKMEYLAIDLSKLPGWPADGQPTWACNILLSLIHITRNSRRYRSQRVLEEGQWTTTVGDGTYTFGLDLDVKIMTTNLFEMVVNKARLFVPSGEHISVILVSGNDEPVNSGLIVLCPDETQKKRNKVEDDLYETEDTIKGLRKALTSLMRHSTAERPQVLQHLDAGGRTNENAWARNDQATAINTILKDGPLPVHPRQRYTALYMAYGQ